MANDDRLPIGNAPNLEASAQSAESADSPVVPIAVGPHPTIVTASDEARPSGAIGSGSTEFRREGTPSVRSHSKEATKSASPGRVRKEPRQLIGSGTETTNAGTPGEHGFDHDWTDGQLVAAVVQRSGGAYGELFRRHSRSVHAASRAILSNRPESEDVVAEVFVAFWLAPESYDANRGSLPGFLRMKAKGRSIDLVRTNVARGRRQDGQARERDQSSDVSRGLLAAELTGRMRGAVDRLPVREREAIQLAFFTGMTYTDVAHFLNAPEGTVKSRIRSGLKRLSASDEVRAERV
jgi:RNA polymerase sigma-70 factor (ECF subfamily)